MMQKELKPLRRCRISLSIHVSIWLVLAAILPLVVTVIATESLTRPALIERAQSEMVNDAKTRVQLIDTYFKERLFDCQTLTQVPSMHQYMYMAVYAPPPQTPKAVFEDAVPHALYALQAGMFRDKNYITWAVFDPQGKPLLYLPKDAPPRPHGKSMVPPEYVNAVKKGESFVSDVYYLPNIKESVVEIYAPIFNTGFPTPGTTAPDHRYLGFMRATLKMTYINTIVKDDQNANGAGSYAFITDANGVRIVDVDENRLFKSVAPLSDDVQQRISREARYGNTANVQVLSDPAAADSLRDTAQQALFQAQPATKNEQYQVVRYKTTVVPWDYFVLSPVNTVTSVANQQLLVTAIIAAFVALTMAVIGLLVGRNLTHPILTSVDYLRGSSESMSTLATRQQDAASEQMWVVDSSQVGLQSVQYYTEATSVAAKELGRVASGLIQHWNQANERDVKQALERINAAARYIENAAQYQNISNQKLATALKVATQVTEQLVAGTTAASDAATQMEQVVTQLRNVVGK